jgi:hypothetical protein
MTHDQSLSASCASIDGIPAAMAHAGHSVGDVYDKPSSLEIQRDVRRRCRSKFRAERVSHRRWSQSLGI